MPAPESRSLQAALERVDTLASRLSAGDVEGWVQRSVGSLSDAARGRGSVETAVGHLIRALQQLDEEHATGRRRREFQQTSPAVSRLLEALQEDLLPALRRAGYRV
jgi:hypothetical protein